MSTKPFRGAAGTLAAVAMLIGADPAHPHTIVGNRVFPVTLAIDDPGVNDELAIPTFSQLTAANFDGTAGPSSYALGFDYAKTITADLAISVGDSVTFQRNPRATGFSNVDVQLKYVFYQNAEHEFIIAGAVAVEIGHTGSGPSSALPSDPFSTIVPKAYIGKGFGDAPADWMRPFAVTAEVDYSIPTVGTNYIDGSLNRTFLTYGGSVQYSLLYRNAFVEEVPSPFNRLIPAFEGVFSKPVSNIDQATPGDFSLHETTGVVGPSLYYIGPTFEVGVMAQIPVNRASGLHPGVLAIVDFFLDDIAPDTLGKPLFGPPQSRDSLLRTR